MTKLVTVELVADIMEKEKVLSKFGRKILKNDFEGDISTYQVGEQEKLTRICLYMTIIFNLTLLFGGWAQSNESKENIMLFEDMKKFASDCEEKLPSYLSHLDIEYLEKYHEAKTAVFVKNVWELSQQLPLHPNEQKYLDLMNNAKEAK
jgi:hypothetical protein